MKKPIINRWLLALALMLIPLIGHAATKYEDFTMSSSNVPDILANGLTTSDGQIKITWHQGEGEKAPDNAWSSGHISLYPGNYIHFEAKEPFRIERVILQLGSNGNQFSSNFKNSTIASGSMKTGSTFSQSVEWNCDEGNAVSSLDIKPDYSTKERLHATTCKIRVYYYDSTQTATPTISSISSTMPSYAPITMTCSTPNAKIHYEIYEYVSGMTIPEVTENSPLYDPEKPDILNGYDISKTWRIRIRAFAEGHSASEYNNLTGIKLVREVSTLAEMLELGADAQNIAYTGNATVTHIFLAKYSNGNPDHDDDLVYLQDETGSICIKYLNPELIDLKVGNGVSHLFGKFEIKDGLTSTTPKNIKLILTGCSSYTLEPKFALKITEEGKTITPKAVTPAEFKNTNRNELVVLNNVEISGYQVTSYSSNYFTFKGVDQYTLRGYHDSPVPFTEDDRYPVGKQVNITGIVDCPYSNGFLRVMSCEEVLEQVATPRGDAISGSGSSSTPSFAKAEMICDTEGAQIHYELYESDQTAPEVTENSPLYDPENPCIYKECTPGKTYKLIARAFKDGMKPSETKYGWSYFIYKEAKTIKELREMDKSHPAGNANFPIAFTGKAVVTHYADEYTNYPASDLDFNELYIQDETGAILVEKYYGDLKKGDVITNFAGQRYNDDTNKKTTTFQLSGQTSRPGSTSYKYAPQVVEHLDYVEPLDITPDTFKDVPESYYVRIKDVDEIEYQSAKSNYFLIKYNGKWVNQYTVRGEHFDSMVDEHLEEGPRYDLYGVVRRYVNNGFLHLTGYEKLPDIMETPSCFPYTTSSGNTMVVPANQMITLTTNIPEANIYYTTDGTEPTTESKLYTVPFMVLQDAPETTIKFFAAAEGYIASDIVSITYERNSFTSAHYNFSDPATLLGEEFNIEEGASKAIEKPLTLTATIKDKPVTLTLTAPNNGTIQMLHEVGKPSCVSLPQGTKISVKSAYSIKDIRFFEANGESINGQFTFEESDPMPIEKYTDDTDVMLTGASDKDKFPTANFSLKKAFQFRTIDVAVNTAQVCTSGIDGIVNGSESQLHDIYNANGYLIKRAATTEEINLLEPGIYIIDGLKFIKK